MVITGWERTESVGPLPPGTYTVYARLVNRGAEPYAPVAEFVVTPSQDSGLFAHWKFDEGEGDIAYDSVGANDGNVYGAQWTTGQIDGALDFDGANDCVALPDNDPVWLPQYNFTLSVWVCFEREPASVGETILDLNHGDSSDPGNELGCKIGRTVAAGELAFQMTTTTNTDEDLFSDDVLVKNKWYHIVAVRDGTTQAIYIDGQLSADRTCSPDPIDFVGGYDDDKVNIGRSTTDPGDPRFHLKGKIDDVRIYNRALSAEEIRQLYQEGTGGLVAHWKFDEGEGDIACDSVGTNDGNVYEAQWTTGKIDGALDFDGEDDYVNVSSPKSGPLDNLDNYSISAWLYVKDRDSMIISRYHGTSSNRDTQLWVTTDTAPYRVRHMTPSHSLYGNITLNEWYHVAATYDGTKARLYTNDSEADSVTESYDIRSNSEPWIIGSDADSREGGRLTNWFNGKIDDVRIYNRALSEEEVLQLYQIPARPYPACWDYLTQCHGDSDNTGDVKGPDFMALRSSWFKCYPDPEYNPCADFDRDGCVDGSDFLILKSNWYKPLPADCTPGDPYEIYR